MSKSSVFADMANQGVTAAEFDKLDGVTATTAELNVVTGGITTLGAVTAGSLGSGITFPAGHTIKIYGPSFKNASGPITKAGTTYTEIHSDLRVTVNNMLSSSNYLIFHYQGEFGARSSGNSWANFSVGESADYTTVYSGIVGFTGNTAGTMVEMGNAAAGSDRYNIKTFNMWSTGHSGSKTFSPIYKSVQGNSIRGAGGNTNVQFFQIYEIQA